VIRTLGFDFNPRVGNVSGICAGADHWCGWGPMGLVYDGAIVDPLAAPGAVDQETGSLYYLTPYQAVHRDVVIAGTRIRRNVPASEIFAGHGCCTWSEWENGIRRAWGWSPGFGAMSISPLAATEFLFVACPVRTPGGQWLVTGTHKGIIVYPWGGSTGYILEGDFFFPHALWSDAQQVIVIVSTDGNGQLQRHTINPAVPQTDLRTYRPTSGAPPIDPVDPVDPVDPIDPEEPPVMELPNELETVRRVAAANRHLLEPYVSENRGIFVQKVLAELGPEWGHVAKTAGEGQYTPPGFEPRMVGGHRITGFAEDAIFHRGANRQVDIALGNQNGGEWVWWGIIDPVHYRSNNPWMERVQLSGVPEEPEDPQDPPPAVDVDAKIAAAVIALKGEMQRTFDAERLEIDQDVDRKIREALANQPPSGSFDPNAYKVVTPLKFTSPLTGSIVKK
jgi:hypothetical protein